jgi:hypothetical protein
VYNAAKTCVMSGGVNVLDTGIYILIKQLTTDTRSQKELLAKPLTH